MDFSGDADYTFAAQGRGLFEKLFREVGRIKDGLGAALAVAHINKDEPAEVAPGMDPAGQGGCLADVFRPQLIAMVRSLHSKMGGE